MPDCPRGNLTMDFLTTEQALADYGLLIFELKQQLNATASPVIGAWPGRWPPSRPACFVIHWLLPTAAGFGGSYGGMLAAWMRMK